MPNTPVELRHEKGLECSFETRPKDSDWRSTPVTKLGPGERYEVSRVEIDVKVGTAVRAKCTTDVEGCEAIGCVSDFSNTVYPLPEPTLQLSLIVGALLVRILVPRSARRGR